MKITDVKVIITSPMQNYVLVKVMTDDPDIYGVGDASLNGRELAVKTVIDEYFTPQLIGLDPDRTEDIWQLLYLGTYWRGGPISMAALAGIDIALWDIRAKRAGLPLYSLLGGKVRSAVPCYVHVFGRNEKELEANAIKLVREGARYLRLRCGLPAAEGTAGDEGDATKPMVEQWSRTPYFDFVIDKLAVLRQAVGREIEILYDLHERFSPREAAIVLKNMETYRPFFVEDPIPPEYYNNLRVVREGTSVPIALGELFSEKWECVPFITQQLLDFIRCDVAHIGGITEARKIGHLAEPFHVKTAWHGPNDVSPVLHAVNFHLNISAVNFGIQEMGRIDVTVDEVIPGGPVYRDGCLHMEDKPGIGCDVNEEAAERYPYRKRFIPICRDDLGAMQPW